MTSTRIPTMRYPDATTMIEWLATAFGFQRHLVVKDAECGIAHAQMTFGDSMIMLGTARDDEFGRLQKTPHDPGGTTQSPHIIVPDVDTICRRARTVGADIVIEPRDEVYGGRGLSCLDPEGHLWNFGSYNPWHVGP